jgi:ComF family protein
MRMHKIVKLTLDALFPPKCPFCGKLAEPETSACPDCAGELTLDILRSGETAFFESVCAPYEYGGKVRDAVTGYKFGGATSRAEPFALAMTDTLRKYAITADCVTWVPLGKKRLRERGYNQSKLLARAVARNLGLPSRELLVRSRETKANSSLESAESRAENVRGAFKIAGNAGIPAAVLLIDDVVTTGATLSECARELRLAGAERVVCACAATTARG